MGDPHGVDVVGGPRSPGVPPEHACANGRLQFTPRTLHPIKQDLFRVRSPVRPTFPNGQNPAQEVAVVRGEPEAEPVLPTRQLILRQASSNGGSVCGDAREQKLRRISSPSLREGAVRRCGLIGVGVVQARKVCPELVLLLGATPPAKTNRHPDQDAASPPLRDGACFVN